jgi:DNA end-binding protein Ku
MKAIWKGAIGFGLVNIPVKLFSAVQESDLDLDMLDQKDHSRIRFMRVNETSGKEVPWENIVRGFDLDGRYVVLSDEDLEEAAAEKTGVISVQDFVAVDEIDPVYYEMPYYLQPEKVGAQAYALLVQALQRSKRAGLATFVMRTKEHLALLRPLGHALVLNRLRFAEEIRDPTDLDIPKSAKVSPQELKLALALIEQHTKAFNISKYKDTYTAQLMKLIRAKARGKRIVAPKMRVVHKGTPYLMAKLKASLKGQKRRAS